jgi:hypothetical protein
MKCDSGSVTGVVMKIALYFSGLFGAPSQKTSRTAGFRFPAETRDFSLHSIQTGIRAPSASHPKVTAGFSTGIKRPRRDAAEIQTGAPIPPHPHPYSWRDA